MIDGPDDDVTLGDDYERPAPRENGESPATAPTIDARLAAERRAEIVQGSLESARSNAGKWSAAAAALFTAVGVASIVQGGKEIRELAATWEDLAGVTFVAAFGLGLWAIGRATNVAHRIAPTEMAKMTGPELLDFEHDRAQEVESSLASSQQMLAAAVALLIGGLAFLFFAPTDEETAGTQVLVLLESGEFVCGELQEQTESGELRIKKEDGPVRTVDATDSITVSPVTACPQPADG